MRFPSVCYRAVTSITIAMVLLVTASVAHAQSPCTSCPSGSTLDTINVDICIGIDTFNLDVVYCHREYDPPSTGALCANGLAINGVTLVQRICASGTPLPADDAATWDAVLCKFSPFGGDLLNIKPQIAPPVGLYCWTITYPRCVERSGNCVIPCTDFSQQPPLPSPCCILRFDFTRDPVTGRYITDVKPNCNQAGQCAQNCTDLGCNFHPEDCDDCP